MWEWLTDTFNKVVEAVTGGSDPPPEEEKDPCDVGNCLAAKETLESRRKDVEKACLLLKMGMVPVRTATWILSRPIRDYVIVLIIAAILGGPMGIVIAVAAYLVVLVFLYAWMPVVTKLGEVLADAYAAEATAIAEVVTECPEDCRGNTDRTECDVIADLPETPWDRLLGLDRFQVP